MIRSHSHSQLSKIQQMSGTGVLKIDCGHLIENYRHICNLASPAKTSSVVKANAYGLGDKKIMEVLKSAGCTLFFVATFEEGAALRQADPDIQIAILNGIWTGEIREFVEYNLCPVLNNRHDLAVWRDLAKNLERTLPAILHVNTGMNRLGMPRYEVDEIASEFAHAFSGIELLYVMSHFCSSEEPDNQENILQYKRFCEIKEVFPNVNYSLANSSGIFRDQNYHFDLVRPGMALYGLNPTPEKSNPMKSVISLEVPVLQVHEAQKGESAGYNCTYQFSENEKIATVCLGYADGILRTVSNQGTLYWKGQKCPILGRVSMDLITVSLQNVRGDLPKPGEMLEVIGPYQSADDLAKSAGTIGYEVLTSLSARYRRIYVSP